MHARTDRVHHVGLQYRLHAEASGTAKDTGRGNGRDGLEADGTGSWRIHSVISTIRDSTAILSSLSGFRFTLVWTFNEEDGSDLDQRRGYLSDWRSFLVLGPVDLAFLIMEVVFLG